MRHFVHTFQLFFSKDQVWMNNWMRFKSSLPVWEELTRTCKAYKTYKHYRLGQPRSWPNNRILKAVVSESLQYLACKQNGYWTLLACHHLFLMQFKLVQFHFSKIFLFTDLRFVGGEMNTSYNCLDRHIKNGKGHRTALIYDSPLTGKIEMYSYQNLQRLVRMLS